MLFNSIDFAVFLPIVFVLYWTVFRHSVRARNWFLIVAGCVFYGWWDWRFLCIWLFTAGVDYLVALGFSRTEDTGRRKFLMGLSLSSPRRVTRRGPCGSYASANHLPIFERRL